MTYRCPGCGCFRSAPDPCPLCGAPGAPGAPGAIAEAPAEGPLLAELQALRAELRALRAEFQALRAALHLDGRQRPDYDAAVPCPTCGGTGLLTRGAACPTCNRRGRVLKSQ